MANELKQAFAASPTVVISKAATMATTDVTVAADATQLDNSTLLYPYGLAVLKVPDTLSAAPNSTGQTVDLYMVSDAIDGTNNEAPVPTLAADIAYTAKYVGSFVFDDQDAAYTKPVVISLEGVRKARFFIQNNLNVSLVYASNPITVTVTPFTYAPA